MSEDRTTQLDRMRYTKNKASSRLAILAIVFDVIFFIILYKSDVENYYYTALIGASIIYNLVFMLTVFLCSEDVKNYKPVYSWVMIVLGAIQIIRIFIIPMNAHQTQLKNGQMVMGDAQFAWMTACLIASAVCLFAGAAVNLVKSRALSAHIASLQA